MVNNTHISVDFIAAYLLCLDVEKRKNPVCGFVTPLEGSEADSHRKPEVGDFCDVFQTHISQIQWTIIEK